MPRHLAFFLFASFLLGCTSKQQTAAPPSTQASAVVGPSDETPVQPISLVPKELTADEKHDAALLAALTHLADRDYPETLAALKTAQAARDSDQVRELQWRVQGLQLRVSSLDQTVTDIQAILDQGDGEQSARLVTDALAQYTEPAETNRLAALKRQADALLAARQEDVNAQLARFRTEAEAALKDHHLRAAHLAYGQLLALRPDPALQQKADELAARLAKYDAARERVRECRKDPERLEEALVVCQEAIQAWDTLAARDDLTDLQLALQKRRERLAVAAFEVRGGDPGLADLGPALADELLPHFKNRYDLVERGQLEPVLGELKLGQDDLLVSEQGRSDLGRLARARYLIVGSVTSVSGVTVHARLVDLRSGLVVQTGKLVAPSAAELLKKAPQLAALLLLSDDEKLAYERQLAREQPPVLASTTALPPLPNFNSASHVAPLVTSSNRPPAFGTLQLDDFDRLPPLPAFAAGGAAPMTEPVGFVEQDQPLRTRFLALHLEVGDNLLRRGRFHEAHARFQLARELDPANVDILTRITLCQPHLPPGRPPVRPRERVAFLNFFVSGDVRAVPPALSTWTPEHLAPYFGQAFDVLDRGEVYWMMGRLGLTVGDVVREHTARRWLGRALGVRYLVLGRLQQSGSFTVTTSLIDAEQGFEVGRGQVFVRDTSELKLRLPELARLTLLSPTERARLEQLAAEQEAEYLRAQEAYQRGQFGIALNLALGLKKKHPFNIRIDVLIGESDRRSKLATLEQLRREELQRQRKLAEAAARRQAELTLSAERARHAALQRAAIQAEEERRRHLAAASLQLVAQARLAFKTNQFSVAVQFFDGAVALRAGDQALLRESAQARARFEADRGRLFTERQARFEEDRRRHHDRELIAARQQWQTERQRYDTDVRAIFDAQRRHDDVEFTRLLDQAQRLKAQGRFDQAAALLQSAKRIKPGDEVERLLTDALIEQARAQAKAQDAARLADLERKLVQEQTRRKQAEDEAKKNWQLYQTALQAAQEAQQRRNYSAAVTKYQEAGRLFHTDAVVTGLQAAKAALDQDARLAAQQKRETDEKARRAAEVSRLLVAGRTAEQARKYDEALTTLRAAEKLDPGNIEIQTALVRTEQARGKALEERQARDQSARVKALVAQAQARALAQQFDAALSFLEAAQKLAPNDPQVVRELATVKQAQANAQATLLATQRKEEEARQQAEQKIQQEEQAKQQAAQARQQAISALKTGDLKAAESSLAAVARLTPNDPALRKLQQELIKAQSAAQREKTQADARARLEADAHRRAGAAAAKEQTKINELLRQAQQAIAKKDFTTAEKLLGDAIALDQTNLAIGRAQRELTKARDADASARAAVSAEQKKKDDAELTRKKSEFAELMKKGKEALSAEEYDKAAKLFEAATKLNPEDADAPLLLGMARRDVARAKAEADAARKAALEEEARQKKEEEDARKREMTEADRKKKAEEDLRKRLALDADAKKRTEALKALTKQQFDAAMKAGHLALTAKRYDDAIKAFERATQLLPDEKDALAQLQSTRRLAAMAKKVPEKSPAKKDEPGRKTPEKKDEPVRKSPVQKDETTPKAPETPPAKRPPEKSTATPAQLLAQAAQLQRQQKWDQALQLYHQVLAASPNDRTAKSGATTCAFHLHLDAGKTALAKRDKDAATKSLEAALKLIPNHAEATKLLKQANELK